MGAVKAMLMDEEEAVRERFPRWDIGFEYGSYVATHENYEASWEGEEDGWRGNGLLVTGRTLKELVSEIENCEEGMTDAQEKA
jgi:hypothetical protein